MGTRYLEETDHMARTTLSPTDGQNLNAIKHLLMDAIKGVDGLLEGWYPADHKEVQEVKHHVSVLLDELKPHGLLPLVPIKLRREDEQEIVDWLVEWFTLTQAKLATKDRGLKMRLGDRMDVIEGTFKERGLSLFTEVSFYLGLTTLPTEEDEEKEAEEGV